MAGFLIPPWYQPAVPTLDDLLIASIIWGFTLASGMFAASKAFRQTRARWKRTGGKLHAYIIMVWAEWAVSTVIGVVSWLFIRGVVPASFWIYFALLCLWVIQIQCICGIIVNRIALLMVDRRQANKIKWIVAIILGLVNISVFIVWIPARLQINETYVYINEIWDRIEKVIFLAVDASLNFYFIYLVRTKLIANGLHKYMPLFKFNIFMVGVSMSLDVILIGSMSIPNGIIYVQFHPLVYMLKLYIEMNIAELIVKVVRSTNGGNSNSYAHGTELQSKARRTDYGRGTGNGNGTGTGNAHMMGPTGHSTDPFAVNSAQIEATHDKPYNARSGGITKIVQTQVSTRHRDEDDLEGDRSSQSSTQHLRNDHGAQYP